jgi:hypothetical protein
LSLGAIGQPIWSYLTSNHPDHAISYSGLAIAYAANYPLDTSAASPNHSFEVVRLTGFAVGGGYTGPDADPSLVLADFLQNTRTGVPSWKPGLLGDLTAYQNYCLAAGLLVSPVIDAQRTATDFLDELLKGTNSTCVWSEGLLKVIPYGDLPLTGNGKTYTPPSAPLYSLNDDNFIQDQGGDPVLQNDIMDQSDAYNVVQLEYLDRSNQYNMAIALASDAANVSQYGMRRKDPDTVHLICTPSVAAISAQLFLQRTLYVRAQYKFKLGWMFALLEPGDIVELTDPGLGLNIYPVRIIQVDEDEKYGLSIIAEDYPIGISTTPLYQMQTGAGAQFNHAVDPGSVEGNLLLWSQDYTQAPWTKSAVTITAAAGTDPILGQNIAQKVTPSTANATHSVIQSSGAYVPAVNYTLTYYAKAAGYSQTQAVMAVGSGNNCLFLFDLTTGALVSQSIGGATVVASTSCKSVGSGWYRIQVTASFPSNPSLSIQIYVGNGGATTFAGDGTSGILLFGAQLVQGPDRGQYVASYGTIAGPVIFNPPSALVPGNIEVWAAVGGGANWGGALVWVSYDGTNYQRVGTTTQGNSVWASATPGFARFGYETAAFPSGPDPDTTDTLSVDLSASSGTLTTAAQSVADAAGTLCLVDSELISYQTATLTGPNRYNLTTYLRRGQMNTPIAAHAVGAPFVRLDAAVYQFPFFAVQAGVSVFVKFQSFNLWGEALQPLANCKAYSFVPYPQGSRAPGPAAWTAVGTVLSNNGVSTPALVITGQSDNPNASAIEFDYRVTGTSAWISAGMYGPGTTRCQITSIQSGQSYDVSVLYYVNGIPSNREILGSTTSGGGTGGGTGSPGNALLNDYNPGTGKTFTCPPGSYAHVDIVLTGTPGAGNGSSGSGGKNVNPNDTGGGGGGVTIVKGFPVTPGTTVLTYTLPTTLGPDATCTATGLAISAKAGTNATTTTSGTGGPASTGNTATGATSTTAYAGHTGGAVDHWDGGGPGAVMAVAAGTVTAPGPDNTNDNTPGQIGGQGGSGSWLGVQPGGGCNLLIVART